jgi:uncharacterized protein (DUF1778 family)
MLMTRKKRKTAAGSVFRLSARDSARVLALLNNPPEAGAKLLAAAKRLPKRG